MLVLIKPMVVKTLSCRTDQDMYDAAKKLADDLGTKPSTILRIAIASTIAHAKRVKAKDLSDLIVGSV